MSEFFEKYWKTLLCIWACLLVADCFIMMLTDAADTVFFILEALTIVCILVSWIVLLINKKWKLFLKSFFLTILITVVLLIPLGFAALYGPNNDSFGKDHPIPEGLEYNITIQELSADVQIDSTDTASWLQLWEGGQGGYYQYVFYCNAVPAGEISLRCFEVTENIPLSEERLSVKSSVTIDSTNVFSKVVNKKEFTIYEGDFGDYYAARIEVWHKDNVTGEQKKLLEKVYRVEGWQR